MQSQERELYTLAHASGLDLTWLKHGSRPHVGLTRSAPNSNSYVDGLKYREYIELIRDVITYSVAASRDIEKWMVPLNSAH